MRSSIGSPCALDRLLKVFAAMIFETHVSEYDDRLDLHRVSDPDSWPGRFLLENWAGLQGTNIIFEGDTVQLARPSKDSKWPKTDLPKILRPEDG